jgi:hypothetical protein
MRYLALIAGLGAAVLAAPSAVASVASVASGVPPTTVWEMHEIVPGTPGSTGFNGSDGVDFGDVNHDGDRDVVSGYEQGRRVTVSLHPGDPTQPWRKVTLPGSGNPLLGPEDAVFADVDDDGALDVIVACEAGRKVTVYFAPVDEGGGDYDTVLMNAANWTKVDLAASVAQNFLTMRVQVADLDGVGGMDILAGGKEGSSTDSALGYYTSDSPRDGGSWTFHQITTVGWTMQMQATDMEGDGDLDVVYSDRDPINRVNDLPVAPPIRNKMGIRWLENPGRPSQEWPQHSISPVTGNGGERYHKWFSLFDWNDDGELDIVDCRSDVAVTGTNELSIWLNGGDGASWTELSVPAPTGIGQCQHMTVADVDGVDGNDLAFTNSHAGDLTGNPDTLSGLVWLKNTGTVGAPTWERHEIGGFAPGIKYDNLAWTDLDGDGDPDAVTSEQHEDTDDNDVLGPGLGVIWYENPER